ncbi:MAG TPA: phenylalanine--tRNA ligase subunit beta [Wolbachia sp.]|uniref:phenylalanine--tRNA ligase subunit beta n=1 Tax=Wolbachia endosymbiont of Pentalonia nigronervosa TaxID=1301914 RepID=UPI000ED4E4E4|nr:phenylalanine--tRNA ligase subunit beta [Wolbachia endosymbiont of Pentalonia nigronervosa]MBD0390903.1 phenylalanine--tRNA ligase subunit beta [Wolbachia endosymbiont of Pentalonia nigronervosa]HCE59604.1 phenylalanine--tRNA ligase subunit beta [Wolbachia sp.]
MKFTLSWLLEYLQTDANLEEITEKLTHIGLEVENVVDNSTLAKFVVAEVSEVKSHPNADKLKLCQVNDGSKILQIVCGANNVRNNMKTVLASVGSTLPESNFTIKPTKIRGVLSEGMLCSASELALTQEESEGIIELSDDYTVGSKFFNCDSVIDVNITPNRGDCLSIYGIARDLAATGIGELKIVSIPQITSSINSSIDVEVTDGQSFISGRYLANVKNKKSPKWLKDRLESIGIRSISTIVDITNYIMISFGRPMHAYDADKIDKKLTVRKAGNKEVFTALNGKEYLLDSDINVISDNQSIHAIAGVIGGKHSECTLETTNIFLESAWFDPVSISRQLNISTDSSYRFARSVDPGFVTAGLDLATKMIIDLCGGAASDIVSAGSLEKKDHYIDFNYQDVSKLGSVIISPDEIFNILTRLGFKVEKDNWNVRVPSWRPDVTMPVDLVEEVVRIYGYEKIKEEQLTSNAEVIISVYDNLRILLSSRGFCEVLTWSFMSSSIAERFGYADKLFTIENPFNSNFNIMRPSIIPNLLQVAADNVVRGSSDLMIFEIGPTYENKDVLSQPKYVLSGIRSGNNLSKSHYNIDREIDVFDAKADFMSILEFFNINCDKLTIEKTDKKYYHPGKSGAFSFKNKIVGYFGELHPSVIDFFEIKKKVVGFEVILENIQNLHINKEKFVDYKYQNVKRDFAFIIDKEVKIGNIINTVKKSSELIIEVLVFDIYHGSNIEPNKMSIALSVTFCSPTHTLTEEEIQKESKAIVDLVCESTGGIIR